MNATNLVVCYKSKILSNGEHQLMLRIIKNRKSSYKSLKISVDAKYTPADGLWESPPSKAIRVTNARVV